MTNQRGRGIGQRDWLADSQQRVRRWLPAPSLSLRRPGVMTRPTLGNVMQRRATKTIEGIPLGPIAGRNDVPLVLRRPIKTSTASEPMLTVLSPNNFDVDEAEDGSPEPSHVAAEDTPVTPAASLPPTMPSRPSAAEPAGGIVTRVFRRLFSSPPPPVDEESDEPPAREESLTPESEAAPPVAEPGPSEVPPTILPTPGPEVARHTTLQRVEAPTPAAREASLPVAETPAASPLSLVTRLLPQRREVDETPSVSADIPPSEAPAAEAPQSQETPRLASTFEDVASFTISRAATSEAAETTPASEMPAEVPLTLRHAAPRLDPDAGPSLDGDQVSTVAQPEPDASPLTQAAEIPHAAAPSLVAETPRAVPPEVSRSVAARLEPVAAPLSPPSVLLRLRRLIRADEADARAAPLEPTAFATSEAAGSLDSTPVASSEIAPAISRSVEASPGPEATARTDSTGLAQESSAPLVVRTRRQPATTDASPGRQGVFSAATAEGPSLQLQPWAPVFRARTQSASQQGESQTVTLPGEEGLADAQALAAPSSNGNVTLSAPAEAYATPDVSRAESPAEASRNLAAAPNDPTKSGAALEQLASQIYERLRRRLVIERERAGGLGSQWQ